MDWKRAIEQERAALGRIVALLCALADLAERAAGRSPVVRTLVLWILRQAETVARDFVGAGADAPSPPLPVLPGEGPADAMRLAASLRALAQEIDRHAGQLLALCGQTGEAAVSPSGRLPALRDNLASLSRRAALAPGAPRRALALDSS